MSQNGNGSRPPIPFGAPSQAIPIVGQTFELKTWFLQLLVMCRCQSPQPVLLIGQPGSAGGRCAACRRVYQLQSISIDPASGQPQFGIASGYVAGEPSSDAT
jgi:hypothetical protein